MASSSASAIVDRLESLTTAEEKAALFKTLDTAAKKAVRAEIETRKTKQPGKEDEDVDDIDWTKLGSGAIISKGKQVEASKLPDVSEADLDALWSALESDDVSDYDVEIASTFDYQGFNAEIVLKQVYSRGLAKGFDKKKILTDISLMCAAAHKKGSITQKNYSKMQKAGQIEYDRLKSTYSLVDGGAKGQPPEVLTISRIGPAFAPKIMRLIQGGKLGPKSFIGPMKSSSLPSVMQTQFFPCLIPSDTPERSRDFLVGLSRAYSTDQTLALHQGKKPETKEVWEKQLGFVELSREAPHPTEKVRQQMCTMIEWGSFYDKCKICVAKIKGLDDSFVVLTKADFVSDMGKFNVV